MLSTQRSQSETREDLATHRFIIDNIDDRNVAQLRLTEVKLIIINELNLFRTTN